MTRKTSFPGSLIFLLVIFVSCQTAPDTGLSGEKGIDGEQRRDGTVSHENFPVQAAHPDPSPVRVSTYYGTLVSCTAFEDEIHFRFRSDDGDVTPDSGPMEFVSLIPHGGWVVDFFPNGEGPDEAMIGRSLGVRYTQVPDVDVTGEEYLRNKPLEVFPVFTDRFTDSGIPDDVDMYRFIDRMQEFLYAGDYDSLSHMVLYPLVITQPETGIRYRFDTPGEFMLHARDIFTSRVIDAVLGQAYARISSQADGVMIGSGEIWIASSRDEGLKILAINPF